MNTSIVKEIIANIKSIQSEKMPIQETSEFQRILESLQFSMRDIKSLQSEMNTNLMNGWLKNAVTYIEYAISAIGKSETKYKNSLKMALNMLDNCLEPILNIRSLFRGKVMSKKSMYQRGYTDGLKTLQSQSRQTSKGIELNSVRSIIANIQNKLHFRNIIDTNMIKQAQEFTTNANLDQSVRTKLSAFCSAATAAQRQTDSDGRIDDSEANRLGALAQSVLTAIGTV